MKKSHVLIILKPYKKLIFYILTCVVVTCLLSSCKKGGEIKKPNIVVIMADDMGYSDLGCFGSEINTPNIDLLAKNGLVMSNFYNTSRCCPSRAALLTGIYQHEAGIGDMTRDHGYLSYQGFLNNQCITIAEALKPAGYTTLMTGKWHVGGQLEHWPLQRGFDRFFGFPRGGGVYFYPFRKGRAAVLDDEEIEVDSASFYSTDAINDYAVQFIEEASEKDNPFFLYVAHIAPHFPLQAWPQDIAKYRGKYMNGFESIRNKRFEILKKSGIIPENTMLSPVDERMEDWERLTPGQKDTFDLRMAIYAAQVDRMDQGIGRITKKLKELGIFDHTLVIFLSDNGGCHEDPTRWLDSQGPLGHPRCQEAYSVSWANVSNTPFRMFKHWVHEGGISTPFIVSYPDMIKEHRLDNSIGHIMDIMPTCLELAGAGYPQSYNDHMLIPLRGRSLVPVFENKAAFMNRTLYWEHEGNRAMRKGQWKLVSKYPQNKWELYNIRKDRTELNNLSEQYPDTVKMLADDYKQWALQTGVIDRDTILNR